jgi:hypothetical protein
MDCYVGATVRSFSRHDHRVNTMYQDRAREGSPGTILIHITAV